MAMSSICRSCSEYFKIANGAAVANKPAPLNPFGNRAAPDPAAVARSAPPAQPLQDDHRDDHPEQSPSSVGNTGIEGAHSKPRPSEPAPAGKRETVERNIECLECGHPHIYRGDSNNTPCPNCGATIPLKDYVINEDWSFRIQTQGDVVIENRGKVRGAVIQCHDLTIRGSFDGGADCTGELHVFKSATISGRVRAKCLYVAERADLTLSHPAKVNELVVKGTILGSIECSGRVLLHRDAIVEGDIKAGSLVVDPGARHTGLVHMTGLSIAEQVADLMAEED